MSAVLTYSVPGHDLSQIHDALLRAGLVPDLVLDVGDDVFLTMPDGTDEAAVAAIVAAHVPQTRYDPATKLAELAPLLRDNRRRGDFRRVREALAGSAVADVRRALLLLTDALEREDES